MAERKGKMAKTIKFNLICDNKPVRTIEDLQNNFSIEDVLSYYNNRLLHRWLDVRGYSDESEKVSAITCEKPLEIIKELVDIFKVVIDEKRVEERLYILEYLEERKELCNIYKMENYKVKEIIDDYRTGYMQLVRGILDNPNDVAKIKANITEMVDNYEWILELNHREIFYEIMEHSPLALMCLLMNQTTRKYYLPIEEDGEEERILLDIDRPENMDKKCMFREICEKINDKDFIAALGKNIFKFSGVTDEYWKDIEPKGKKCMIISMESGDYVRSAGKVREDLAYEDVLDRFVILDGIDYKSNSPSRKLLYMEV